MKTGLIFQSVILGLPMNQQYEVVIDSVGDGREISIGYCTDVDLPPPVPPIEVRGSLDTNWTREEKQRMKSLMRRSTKKPARGGGKP